MVFCSGYFLLAHPDSYTQQKSHSKKKINYTFAPKINAIYSKTRSILSIISTLNTFNGLACLLST